MNDLALRLVNESFAEFISFIIQLSNVKDWFWYNITVSAHFCQTKRGLLI